MLNVVRIQRVSTAWGTEMVKRGPHRDFLTDLNQRAVAVMALRQGSPMVPLLAIIPYSVVVLIFLCKYRNGVPFLFLYKRKRGNLIIGIPKGRWVH